MNSINPIEASSFAPSAAVKAFLAREPGLLIDGAWCAAETGEAFDVLDPATGAAIARSARGGAADIDRAVKAARRSFEARVWSGRSASERSAILWRLADLIEQNADELLELEVLDNGMPYAFGRYVVFAAAEWFRHNARAVTTIFGRNVSGSVSGQQAFHAFSENYPVGVVGLITPWNGPIASFALKVAPALASGCSAVVKPAENTPLTALRVAELALDAGIPPGVLNVVTGYGREAGAALVDHPDVDKVSFTGSTAVGKGIARASADNLKRVTLELGGKSPCIIFDDADLDVAIPAAAMGIFANTGQVCFAGSRLFVQRTSFDKVVAGLEDFARGMKIGSGMDRANNLGPVISQTQRDRVMEYVGLGIAEGAKLVTGGRIREGAGYFIEPTIFADVNADMRIVREEIFGPVLAVTPFDSAEEVVAAANATRYGLGAGVFTNDINKAHHVADRLNAGNVWVNCYGVVHPSLPFGGFKESGWGREAGTEGIEAFLEKKAVVVQLTPPR